MKTIEYLRQYARQRPLFLSVLRAKECALYQPYVPFTGRSLDYGCGDGFFARVAFGAGAIDVGLDVAESRMDQAEGVYKQIRRYDGRTIPYGSALFDTIVSNSVLEHVQDLSHALFEIHRILKPGGMFLTTVMAKPWEENLFGSRIIGDRYKTYMRRKQVHSNLLSLNQWKKAFVDAGFTVKKVTGHVTGANCILLDLLHYVSVPSLIAYTLFHRWVLWPTLTQLYPLDWLATHIDRSAKPQHSGALFFVLTKSARR